MTFQAEAGCHARDPTGDQRWQDILGRVLPDIGNDSISCQDITSADGRRCSLRFLPSPDPSPVPSPRSGPLMTRKTLRTVTSLPWCASTRKRLADRQSAALPNGLRQRDTFLYDSESWIRFYLVCFFLYSGEFFGMEKVFKQMCKPQSHRRCRRLDPRVFGVEVQWRQHPFPLERQPYIFLSFFSVCKGQHSRIGLFPTERWAPGGEDEGVKGVRYTVTEGGWTSGCEQRYR